MDKEKLKQKVEEEINKLIEPNIQTEHVKLLGALVDIHKDIENEEYWDKKKEVMGMNYSRGYSEGDYGRRSRDARGRYTRRGNFREGDPMEDMYGAYQEYSEYKEYGANKYGHTEIMKSLEYMMESVVDFINMLKKEAASQEEMKIIQKYIREISEM